MAKSVSGGSEDAEDRSPRSLRRSGGRAGGAGRGSRWSHRDQRGTRSRRVRRVQSARRGRLLPEVRLRGAGLLLPGVLSVRVPVLLRSRRVRAEPAGGRIPIAAAVSGAGPAPAAAPDRRRVSPRTLRAAWRRDQDRVPVGVDPEAATSAAGRGPAATVPDHALAGRVYSAASR